jgi:multidrug efflux pump
MEHKFKEFKPTSWSIDNKTSIYVLTVIIAIFGIINYNTIPKEQFPEIVIPTIIVSTIYPGTSPSDMETLITRPLEKNIKAISGVRNITSNSVQDFSSVVVEFNTDVEVSEAKQRVNDAVDKTKADLPNNLPTDPNVMEIDFSEIPIMYVNLSGNYDLVKLKKYADLVQDRIESLKEITRVDIVGALDREIQIDVDMFKMQAASVTFNDIERAVAYENITVAGGTINMSGMRRSIRVVGEFNNIETIKNITLGSSSGALIKLKDIADVRDSFKEQESFARLDGENVITLNIIKKSGQNLIEAADKIKETVDDLKKNNFPADLNVVITGDMSHYTRTTLADLNNTIIIGFILVTIVLMFFMGLTNAIFVGLSIPLAMALAYIVMPSLGFSMNMLVMFSFIFALGIVVDDAIVVIENTHRILNKTNMDIKTSAKFAAGEVFMPIFSGTLTTLAPFFPLAFWPGIVGQFMYYIPVVLILTLFASLIVAYIINPVFAVSFMKKTHTESALKGKKLFTNFGIIVGLGTVFHLIGWRGFGNFTLFIALLFLFHNLYGYRAIMFFQTKVIPALLVRYERFIRVLIKGKTPYFMFGGLIVLFVFTMVLTGIVKPKVEFFPPNEPNNVFVFIKTPVGTDVLVTDSIAAMIEQRIMKEFGENNPIIESVITNVALGASSMLFESGTKTSNKAKITVNFVEFVKRGGQSTSVIMERIRNIVQDIPGVEVSVEKNHMGPPTGKAINIEVSGENLDELIQVTQRFIQHINNAEIHGIEELKSDFDNNKPELLIDIDRKRANNEGITTGQIGMEIRTAVLGKEISKYRDGEDQYPIQLRYNEYMREDIERIMNLKITYRDMNSGLLRQIPLSSLANVTYINTYGGITRKNVKRVITVSSNVITGYNANQVLADIKKSLTSFEKPDGIEVAFTGEQEFQEEASLFLGKSMLFSIMLILFILITQFNSISKPIIILSEVLFSIIGVLIGYMIFGMSISIIMTGMGIVALAGIVIRNGILLVEFIDLLKSQGMRTREAIIQGGKTRITPVLLTAVTTILGLIPLAVGFNIDFISLFTSFSPHIHFGGDNVMFFGSLAWTIIFGLAFATILTLLFIPIMYFILYAGKIKYKRRKSTANINFEKLY